MRTIMGAVEHPFDRISEPLGQRLVTGLLKLGLALRSQSWKGAGRQGLTPTQGSVLTLLASGRGRRLSGIAEALAVSPATASEAVAALVRKELVVKTRASGDRRAVALDLTVQGRAEAARSAAWPDFLIPLIEELPVAEAEAFYRVLVKLIRALQERGQIPVSRMCVTCRYFKPHVYRDRDAPHYCGLVDAPFGERHLRLDCPEHEQAPLALRERNWARFESGMNSCTDERSGDIV
jgi:DNA-binding MarR family transcriptional regulator